MMLMINWIGLTSGFPQNFSNDPSLVDWAEKNVDEIMEEYGEGTSREFKLMNEFYNLVRETVTNPDGSYKYDLIEDEMLGESGKYNGSFDDAIDAKTFKPRQWFEAMEKFLNDEKYWNDKTWQKSLQH